MSFRPRHSTPSIPDSASSPISPSRRLPERCATSTHSPLASPTIYFGSVPALWPGTAGPCGASTHKHSPASRITTRLSRRCSPGSRLRTSSPHTSACVRYAAAEMPAVGPVRYIFPFPSPGLPGVNLSSTHTTRLLTHTHHPFASSR